MGWRLLLYPIPAVVVPLWWLLLGPERRATRPYPAHIDLLLVLPFLLDTAGNAANLFDRISWWDDLMHVTNWVPLVLAFGFAVRPLSNDRRVVAGLTLGFGAVVHILWEIGEYLTFVADSPIEASSAYRDTIGDLVGSLLGSLLGATSIATLFWNVGRPPTGAPRRGPGSARPHTGDPDAEGTARRSAVPLDG
jgi:hypothetical protein